MIAVVSLLFLGLSPLLAAPLYGDNGGYSGYASYSPNKNHFKTSAVSRSHPREDKFRASAGSPDVSRTPIKENAHAPYNKHVIPKSYDALKHKPVNQHGYGSNTVGQGIDSAPYAKATLYGQGSTGGYKLSDTYQNQHIELNADKNHDYKDDYISYPQPYEYGYDLKDAHGNTQHRKESSDGKGKVSGSYGFTDEHGIYRSVQYIADKEGFRASVKTNEPGTDNQNPADVHMDSEQSKH